MSNRPWDHSRKFILFSLPCTSGNEFPWALGFSLSNPWWYNRIIFYPALSLTDHPLTLQWMASLKHKTHLSPLPPGNPSLPIILGKVFQHTRRCQGPSWANTNTVMPFTLSTLPNAPRPTELPPGPWSLPDHFTPQSLACPGKHLPIVNVSDLAAAILRSSSGPSHYSTPGIWYAINKYVEWISNFC